MRFRAVAVLTLLLPLPWAESARAQEGAAEEPVGARASAVPSPSEFHGYPLGSRYTITSALYDYYQALAEASPRVEYAEYGESVQGRPLPMVMVSSEANLARKDQIRANLRRLTGATEPLPEAELQRIIANTPSVVWAFIVDTDEEAGVEVLQEVAYLTVEVPPQGWHPCGRMAKLP